MLNRLFEAVGRRAVWTRPNSAPPTTWRRTGPSGNKGRGDGSGNLLNQMIDINQAEGQLRASSMNQIGDFVDDHPEETVAIIRGWMYQDQGRG